jgi:hypothetical protein
MSPHLHHEIVRARQREIAASTVNAHHAREVRLTSGPHKRIIQHFARAVAALGVCLAIPIAVTVDGALASPGSVKFGDRVSAQKYAGEIRALEANGYAPTGCSVGGTLMRNFRTGRSVTVKL